MLLVVDDETELYAEYILTDDDEEDAGYDMLREDIIEQAEEIGLDPDDLEFWYD